MYYNGLACVCQGLTSVDKKLWNSHETAALHGQIKDNDEGKTSRFATVGIETCATLGLENSAVTDRTLPDLIGNTLSNWAGSVIGISKILAIAGQVIGKIKIVN